MSYFLYRYYDYYNTCSKHDLLYIFFQINNDQKYTSIVYNIYEIIWKLNLS